MEYLQWDKVCMSVYRLVTLGYLGLSYTCTFLKISVPFSLEEEMVPRVHGIKLGRFQVNHPSYYIRFAISRHNKISLL